MVERKSGFPLVIAGPSGAGKTTLARVLVEREEGLRFSVSDTSRPIRGSERDGVDYHFLGEAAFRRRIEEDAYAEWALVHGDYYGTPRAEIDGPTALGETVVLDIDVQGSEQIRARYPGAVGVFIVPPSVEVMEKRLRGRGTEEETRIRRRIEDARVEMRRKFEFDYIVINDDLDAAIETIRAIVRAERWRSARLKDATGDSGRPERKQGDPS
ncbi:MAG: guanylate kinase [Candidatus Eisenbacteria bacterium]|nr:guanylate kinase [Candidatus Eisenbacteria bacterium]